MTTDPSTVVIVGVRVVAAAMKTHFLAAEETRTCPKYKQCGERSDSTIVRDPNGRSSKIPGRTNLCKSRAEVSRSFIR
jgi:hypothetical protein